MLVWTGGEGRGHGVLGEGDFWKTRFPPAFSCCLLVPLYSDLGTYFVTEGQMGGKDAGPVNSAKSICEFLCRVGCRP